MDSTAIYEDLNEESLNQKLLKLQQENKTLQDRIKVLENDIGRLCKELTQMKVIESNLKINISELFNTAQVESDRKQRMITELQTKLDNLLFKRNNRQQNHYTFNVNKRPRENDTTKEVENKKLKQNSDDNSLKLVKVNKDSSRHKYTSKERGSSSRSVDRNRDSHGHKRDRREHQNSDSEKERHSRRSGERDHGCKTENIRLKKTTDYKNAEEHKNSRLRSVSLDRNRPNGEFRISNNCIAENIKIEIKNDRRTKVNNLELASKPTSRNEYKKITCSVPGEKVKSHSTRSTVDEKIDYRGLSKELNIKEEICDGNFSSKELNIKEELCDSNFSNDEYVESVATIKNEYSVKDETVPLDLKKEIKVEHVENTNTTRRRRARCVIKVVH